jgi:uncharacterized membrane protein YhdT
MWNRIYLAVLAVASLVMLFLTYYSWTWLQSVGDPRAAIDNYVYFADIALKVLLMTGVLLLILANFVLARTRRSWAMWVTFVYFAVFTVVRYFWLERAANQFNAANTSAEAAMSWGPVLGVIFCIAAAAIVFSNQLLLVRLTERIYPTAVDEPELISAQADEFPLQPVDEKELTERS